LLICHSRESGNPEGTVFNEYWIPDKDPGNDELGLLQEPQELRVKSQELGAMNKRVRSQNFYALRCMPFAFFCWALRGLFPELRLRSRAISPLSHLYGTYTLQGKVIEKGL